MQTRFYDSCSFEASKGIFPGKRKIHFVNVHYIGGLSVLNTSDISEDWATKL